MNAISVLRDNLEPGQVEIVGSGPEQKTLRDLSRKIGVKDLVVWTGELNQSAVRDRLSQAGVFLLPSRWEGLSNAGLEAMERGLVPIITECGGLDIYVDTDMGWVIQRESVAELVKAMKDVLAVSPQKLHEMGARARALILSDFDIQVIAARYIELFESLRPASVRNESDD